MLRAYGTATRKARSSWIGNRTKRRWIPVNNSGYVQLFGGETAACVAHGLQDASIASGRPDDAPHLDNASGMRIMASKSHSAIPMLVRERQRREQERYMKLNLFVPFPNVTEMQAFNRELLGRCENDWQREHYKKGISLAKLFEDDKKMSLHLSKSPFVACRYTRVKTDDYRKFIDGKHFYSTSPEWVGRCRAGRCSHGRRIQIG